MKLGSEVARGKLGSFLWRDELFKGLTGTGLDLRADAVDSYPSVAYFFRCGAGEADDAVLDANQQIHSVLRRDTDGTALTLAAE